MAIRRSLGVISFTTFPPIRISPDVGVSSPAIIRKSVVFPEPDGPRKTRNSPSRVSRSTSLTAPSSPCLNTLVSFLVSTTAIRVLSLFKSLEDAFVLGFCRFGSLLRSYFALGHGGKHRWYHPALERLVDCCGAVPRIADIRRPIQHVAQNFVFVRRSRPGVIRDFLRQVGDRRREAGEIIELTCRETVVEGVNVIDQELLRAVLVLRKFPDHVAIHHVFCGNAANRAFQGPADHDVLVDGKFFSFRLARNRNRVRHVGNLSRQHCLIVVWGSPGKYFGRLRFL